MVISNVLFDCDDVVNGCELVSALVVSEVGNDPLVHKLEYVPDITSAICEVISFECVKYVSSNWPPSSWDAGESPPIQRWSMWQCHISWDAGESPPIQR